MANKNYGYNEKVADVVRPLGQGKVKKAENGFRTVDNVEVMANSEQNRVDTVRVGSGEFRGVQTVRGRMQVLDANGSRIMVMGYQKGKF